MYHCKFKIPVHLLKEHSPQQVGSTSHHLAAKAKCHEPPPAELVAEAPDVEGDEDGDEVLGPGADAVEGDHLHTELHQLVSQKVPSEGS